MRSKDTSSDSPMMQFLKDRYIGNDPQAIADYEKGLADLDIAQAVYDLRTEAGLTQRKLAAKVGTTASVICRLEDADYEGHSLAMLKRIAAAVGKRVEIRFVPMSKTKRKPRKAA
jgi:ribosome-binding protein aMBF1 (putative translation factor)